VKRLDPLVLWEGCAYNQTTIPPCQLNGVVTGISSFLSTIHSRKEGCQTVTDRKTRKEPFIARAAAAVPGFLCSKSITERKEAYEVDDDWSVPGFLSHDPGLFSAIVVLRTLQERR